MQSYLDWSCPWDAAVKPNLYEGRLEDRRSSIECDIIVVWKKEIERDWHKSGNEGNGEERSGKRLEQGDRSDKIIHNSNSHIFDIFQVSFLLFIKKTFWWWFWGERQPAIDPAPRLFPSQSFASKVSFISTFYIYHCCYQTKR